MKRTLSLLLSILMILSVFGITASASNEKIFKDFKYRVTGKNSVTITEYIGKDTEVNIPGKINGKTVTVIGSKSFHSNEKIKKVTMPNSIKKIGNFAFYCCFNLESVVFPKSLTTIEASAFNRCSALTNVTLPKNLSVLEAEAFYGCRSLDEISIPDKITEIAAGVFCYCTALKKVNLPDSVTQIKHYAFSNCASLEKIKLPSKLSSIGDSAFSDCYILKSIIFPNSVTSIGSYVFDGCSKLESVSGGKGLKKIGSMIFRDSAFSKNKKNWENGALYFNNCLVDFKKNFKGNYKIKEGTTVVARDIFNDCKKLTGVYIPKNVFSFSITQDEYIFPCFNSPNLKKITVADDNNYFKSVDGVLYSKNMKILYRYPAAKSGKSFSVPKSVKTIWEGAFSGCENLFKVSFHPNSTAIIKGAAFNCCKNLSDITITNGVTLSSDAGFGWYYENDDDRLVKGLKFKGNSSNKSLMSYLNIYGFNDCFVPICKDGSEKHTLKTAKAKAPTYFTKGYKAFKYCTVCKEKFNVKFIDKKTIPDTVISVAGGKGQISIKYNAIKGANGFRVMHVNQSTAKYDTKTFSTDKSKTVKITGLDPAEYTVAVRVFQKNNGKTYWSNWIWINGDNITVK